MFSGSKRLRLVDSLPFEPERCFVCPLWLPALHMNCPVLQLTLSHPELLVAVEMLSSVVLMNQAMDAGDRAALWRQLSSPVTGLSNVEESYAQRLARGRLSRARP